MKPKRICINCRYHKRTHFISCHHPKLGRADGINVTMLREMGNEYQKEAMSGMKICGREARWYKESK